MDFTYDHSQQAVADLAAQLLGRAPDWGSLATAGLLGVTIPEKLGGLGLGPVALGALLVEVGRAAAPVPALPVLGYAVPALVAGASPAVAASVLPAVADGSLLVTVALVGSVAATASVGGRWVLDGSALCVPAGLSADLLVVAAGSALFLVDASAPGVVRERQDTLTGEPEAAVHLAGVRVDEPLDPAAVEAVALVGRAATCAVLSGVADTAVRLTADHVRTREQFGQPLAAFQAVRQRLADAYVDTTAVRLTAQEALWRLEAGLPADRAVAVAALHAAEAGRRVARAAAHLHGGTGVDRAYPLHRYYALAKQLELTLGGGARQAAALGRLLALGSEIK